MADRPQQDRDLKLPAKRIGGRFVTAYSPELALTICERVAEGDTLANICKDDGMPARASFHRWVVLYPELSQAYLAARELSAHALEEEALDLAHFLANKTSAPEPQGKLRAYEIALGQLRWSAARRNPRAYGDTGQTKIVVPIQINSGLDLGQGGASKSSGESPDNIYDITATISEDKIVEVPPDDKNVPLIDSFSEPDPVARKAKQHRARKARGAQIARKRKEPPPQ